MISMKLNERSYSTKIIRPKPLIHQEDDGSLIVLATVWGQAEHGQRAIDEVVKYVNAAKADVEVTSPFEYLNCLTDEANYVRTALHIANDILYRGENRKEYLSGVEIMALFCRGNQVAWAHVGCPSLFIQRSDRRLQPLSIGMDLSSELKDQNEVLAPLPAQLLGLEPTCHVRSGHTRISDGDQLILLGSSLIANSLLIRPFGKFALADITNRMIQEEPENPFWLGLVDLADN